MLTFPHRSPHRRHRLLGLIALLVLLLLALPLLGQHGYDRHAPYGSHDHAHMAELAAVHAHDCCADQPNGHGSIAHAVSTDTCACLSGAVAALPPTAYRTASSPFKPPAVAVIRHLASAAPPDSPFRPPAA